MESTYLTRATLIGRLSVLGNDAAWEEFVFYYQRFILNTLNKLGVKPSESQDLSQDVLLKLWKQLPDFNYNSKQGSFRAWLYVVIRNTAYDYFDKQQSRAGKHEQLENVTVRQFEPPEVEKITEEQWRRHISLLALESLSGKVSENSIEILKASINGESLESIALRLEMEKDTVNRYKNRMKEKLVAEIKRLREMLE